MLERAKSVINGHLPRLDLLSGSERRMMAAGGVARMRSIASVICGDDADTTGTKRVLKTRFHTQCEKFAADGGVAFVAPSLAKHMPNAFTDITADVPQFVDLFRPLPGTPEELHMSLRTSTTREDLRRIRKAGFTYRVSTDPDAMRTFHGQFAQALLDKQHPGEGYQEPVESAVDRLSEGGELICLDYDGEWVAGIYNTARELSYELGALGIRDGRDEIRRMHTTSALLVQSFERGVELGFERASLGMSLPFLGKGPVWFKAKWGGVLKLNPSRPRQQVLLDLRHESMRQMLSDHPILFCDQDELVLALWQESGSKAIQNTVRDASRFPGISRWCVIGDPETLAKGREAFEEVPKITAIPLPQNSAGPIWLGEVLRRESH